MGFLSSAYSAQVSPTVAVSTRFGVNVYSYESDLTIGGEWWIGRGRGKRGLELPPVAVAKEDSEIEPASRVSLRPVTDEAPEKTALVASPQPPQSPEDRDGVLKARVAGDWVCPRLY
jgi:distribution and morphology protein 10